MENTFEAVKEVVAEVLKIDSEGITKETRFIEDLKADSMDQFFLIDGFCENLISTSLTKPLARSILLATR